MHRKKGIASSSSSNIVKNGRRNQVSLRPPLLNRNETNKTVNNDKDVVESQSCRLKQSNHEITISEKHQVTNLVESRHNPTNEETSNTVISQQLEETAHLNISIIVKYNCPVFLLIRTDLANSIAKGALSIRTNEDVFAVIKLREQMLGLLLSYSLPWLWLGLETVFQKHISIEDMLDNFNDPCRSQRRQLIGLHSLDSQKVHSPLIYLIPILIQEIQHYSHQIIHCIIVYYIALSDIQRIHFRQSAERPLHPSQVQ
jgi:hypothetical protein